jgi:hypothetical protein
LRCFSEERYDWLLPASNALRDDSTWYFCVILTDLVRLPNFVLL